MESTSYAATCGAQERGGSASNNRRFHEPVAPVPAGTGATCISQEGCMSDDKPSPPWVLRQGPLRFKRLDIDDKGRTVIVFSSTSRASPLRELHISIRSVQAVDWVYGYTIVDPNTHEKHIYRGRFGDPEHDTEVEQP